MGRDRGVPQPVLGVWGRIASSHENYSAPHEAGELAEALEDAHEYLASSWDAREFVEGHMVRHVRALTNQDTTRLQLTTPIERQWVRDALFWALKVVTKDLEIQVARGGKQGECILLETLEHILNREKPCYLADLNQSSNSDDEEEEDDPDHQPQQTPQQYPGHIHMTSKFQQMGGFQRLVRYLQQKRDVYDSTKNGHDNCNPFNSSDFVELEILRRVLFAAADLVPGRLEESCNGAIMAQSQPEVAQIKNELEQDAVSVGKVVMSFVSMALLSRSDHFLTRVIAVQDLFVLLQDLRVIHDRLVVWRRSATCDFYHFWRQAALRMLVSTCRPLHLLGWEMVRDLIAASQMHRPPPRAFQVQHGLNPEVNGVYEFSGMLTPDGYHVPGSEIRYVLPKSNGNDHDRHQREGEGGGDNDGDDDGHDHDNPNGDPDNNSRPAAMKLCRYNMKSGHRWWFLSDVRQGHGVDFYYAPTTKQETWYPPTHGWESCTQILSDEVEDPLLLSVQAIGLMVPKGRECDTLEHHLARWAIENELANRFFSQDLPAHCQPLSEFLKLYHCHHHDCDEEEEQQHKQPQSANSKDEESSTIRTKTSGTTLSSLTAATLTSSSDSWLHHEPLFMQTELSFMLHNDAGTQQLQQANRHGMNLRQHRLVQAWLSGEGNHAGSREQT